MYLTNVILSDVRTCNDACIHLKKLCQK